MKKISYIISMMLVVALLLAGCGNKEKDGNDTNDGNQDKDNNVVENKDPEYIGNNLKYDINSVVNNGEKIDLVLWTDQEVESFYTAAADSYMKIHDNVNIKIVVQPWGDYWTKLPLALNAGNGPDLYRSHPSFINNLKEKTYELPEDVFPMEQLKPDFPEVEKIKVDDKLYSIPLGTTFGGGIYYNKAMWTEAGLTETDIPKTWDEFAEIGKKLTKKDSKGNITQYGFSIDHTFENMIIALNLQKGEPIFKEDQFTWNFDNETTYNNIDLLKDFKEDGFMMYSDGDCEDQMGNGQVAMIYQWNWVGGYLNSSYPDVDWGFFMMPTEDGSVPPAYDTKVFEWLLSVSATDEKKREVAFDFLKYYVAENKNLIDNSMHIGVIPAKSIDISDDERLKELPNIGMANEYSDRLVFLGVIPTDEAKAKGLRSAGSDIFINNKEPKEVIKAFQKKLMEDTERNGIEYKSIENHYEYYSEFNK
ncbi:sugar ABC transporter substrate-binding protein [Vallitalea longa]|uniref:Sugar ABC transporter substrate-binding protein n=1 Tax=Vallitalea longa TaxID=2936439 RepID=A0A9W5YAU2_9FIRM|nr:extracellular solute-binding protein [Vallitalea longa]GKX29286.1 sugar ABC transporter substrate-binding protein [Vallitalea longa]